METQKTHENRDCFLTLIFICVSVYILLFVCTKL